jgi:dehydrogenase/reductase SDR family protein 7B
MNWENKKVWIIGASSGIGQGLAIAINQLGGFVVLSSRSTTSLQNTQSQLRYPEKSGIIALDLTNDESISKAIDQYETQFKKIDILIHSGGISQRSLALETTLASTELILKSNFLGQIPITQFAAKKMIAQKNGKIVVITSFTGKWGFFLRSSYAASKHALHGYYDSLRMEIENDGVQIHLITPGFVATDISKNALDAKGQSTGEMDNNQQQGIGALLCAQQIIQGIDKEKTEFGVGGKELKALWIHQYFPSFFQKILRKQSAR